MIIERVFWGFLFVFLVSFHLDTRLKIRWSFKGWTAFWHLLLSIPFTREHLRIKETLTRCLDNPWSGPHFNYQHFGSRIYSKFLIMLPACTT